ncbi:1050_t:CDS:1 [Funneliformis caledonium]|uniref:1050_t:CDS:1 n=1 Tax=Funneliformis caledonium TaxID=1117310 RepID=A0A9N9GN31_9GLOM|nr:1050_t:CDS:1 [Funneliformis caledonium]
MSPLQYNHWVIIDESSSIATNQRSNLPQPPLPIIRVPFPPNVNPEELILKPRKAKSKLPTKPPNAFMIYRMQYVKELHAKDYRLPMRSVSASVASAWREEPDHVVEYYEDIAREASKIYNQKYPKPTLQPRLSVEKHGQKRRNGLTNATSPPLGHFNDHALNHNDNTRQNHYRYFDYNRPLNTGTTTLENHSLASYHNHNMHSPPPLAIPSLMTDYSNSGILGRTQMRSPRTLSAPYSSTNSTNSLLPANLHIQLPHVNSLSNAPLQNYMEESSTSPTGWDFANTHN